MSGKVRYVIIGAVTLAVLALAALALFAPPGPVREKKLPDGTVIRVVKVSFGKRDLNYLPLRLLDRVKVELIRDLPAAWSRTLFKNTKPVSLGGSITGGPIHTNLDSLHIWITQRDTNNGLTTDGVLRGVIIDDEGTEFPSSQSGWNFGAYAPSLASPRGVRNLENLCDWLTFEAFPRQQKKFRLQLFSDDGKHLADFDIENPAPAPRLAHWNKRPVPMTNQEGDVAFVLSDVRIRPDSDLMRRLDQLILQSPDPNYHAPLAIAPRLVVRESGKVSPEWQPGGMELWDSSGNCISKSDGSDSLYLSPREDAWKLLVKYYGSEHTSLASNTVAKIAGVKVPKPGEFVSLDHDWNLAGVAMHPVALAGPGRVSYSKGTVIGAAPLLKNFFGIIDPFDFTNINGASVFTLSSAMPQLSFRMARLADDQRLSVRAVDEQGREYYAESMVYGGPAQWPQTNSVHYLEMQTVFVPDAAQFTLNLPADATNVDLYFCIHNAHPEEFIFKPPTNQ